jgi:hypothetical protein
VALFQNSSVAHIGRVFRGIRMIRMMATGPLTICAAGQAEIDTGRPRDTFAERTEDRESAGDILRHQSGDFL